MIINVAGAGAGKTTNLARRVMDETIDPNKVIYVVAFTNSAANKISEKISFLNGGSTPKNIIVSTIHSFLYREFIYPFYYILYEKHFSKISAINLPKRPEFRQKKLGDLEKDSILHLEAIPQKAKWVVFGKTGDCKEIKNKRKKILYFFSQYCQKIYIDEAQDIDEDMMRIFKSLDDAGINVEMFGDPKQDIKGYGCFRLLINDNESPDYIIESHRCPSNHLLLSNILAPEPEKQFASKDNENGAIDIYFESDYGSIEEIVNCKTFGLIYIQKKNNRILTRDERQRNNLFDSVEFEIHKAVNKKNIGILTEKDANRLSYLITDHLILENKAGNDVIATLRKMIAKGYLDYDKGLWARMYELFDVDTKTSQGNKCVVVKSIESVKGLENKECLFILNRELAPYLFDSLHKDDNKNKHLLYVALTRSLMNLSILILKEVEELYQKSRILSFFETILGNNSMANQSSTKHKYRFGC